MPALAAATDAPLLIADDPVLDMLNTVANVNGQPLDFWQSDVDVSDWLVRAGWLAEPVAGRYPPGVLLAVARHLRAEEVREGGRSWEKLGEAGRSWRRWEMV